MPPRGLAADVGCGNGKNIPAVEESGDCDEAESGYVPPTAPAAPTIVPVAGMLPAPEAATVATTSATLSSQQQPPSQQQQQRAVQVFLRVPPDFGCDGKPLSKTR